MAQPKPRYQPGDRIGGRYQVHKALMGGMSEVYLCLDLEQNYPFALKTFQQRYQSSALREAFEQEVATWVALEKHPNIVRCFYMDILDNQPFMVLEWIAGEAGKGADLRGWLRHGPLDLKIALEITIDVVRGLVHAQKKQPGLVHRDLKPENILVAQGGLAKVTDFGLAQIVAQTKLDVELPPSALPLWEKDGSALIESEWRRQSLSLIEQRGIAGTPAYMAPEQWRGESLDERTDIYAIGCILYEMLTGRWPFQLNFTPQQARQWLSAMQTQHETKNLIISSDELTQPITDLLQTCLEKVSTDRPPDMATLLKQVETIYQQDFNQLPPAPLQSEAFTSADYINRGATYDNLRRYERALADYEQAIELDPNNVVAYNNRGSVYQELSQYEMALADFNRALELDPNLAQTHSNRGNSYIYLGEYDNALKEIDHAIKLSPDKSQFHVTRSRIYQLIGDAESNDKSKMQHYQASLADCERAIQLESTSAQAYVQRGVVYDRLNDLDNALADFNRALERDPDNSGIYVNRGAVYDKLKRFEDALADYTRAIELSPSDEQIQRLARCNRGMTYVNIETYDRAISDFEYATEVAPRDSKAHLTLGLLYAQRGRLWKALSYFEKTAQLGDLEAVQFVTKTRRLLDLADDSQPEIFRNVFDSFIKVTSIEEMQQFLMKHPFVTDTDLQEEIRQRFEAELPTRKEIPIEEKEKTLEKDEFLAKKNISSKQFDKRFDWIRQLVTDQEAKEQNQ